MTEARLTVAGRGIAVAVGVVLLGAVHLRHRPATLCPFRSLTGLPCPFCGSTTAVADIGRGEVRQAVLASPLALVMLVAFPVARSVARPAWWSAHPGRRRALVTVVLVAAELWQLARFHRLGF